MKLIPNFPNYAITEDGKVWSFPRLHNPRSRGRGKWLKPWVTNHGHLQIELYRNGIRHRDLIHRLVLQTFVGQCPEGMECCHYNGNPQDNRLENLRWGTHSENKQDQNRHGWNVCKGENHPYAKLTEYDVKMIIGLYKTGVFTQLELAKIAGVSRSSIEDIIHNRTWKHIKRNE